MKSHAGASLLLSQCRTPRGVRGLKSAWETVLEAGEELSHPSRGAWIEILFVISNRPP